MRDHSWGLRSTMGPRTQHGGVDPDEAEVDHRRFRLWVPFQTTAHTGFFHTHEAGRGETLDFEGRAFTDAEGRSVRLVACRHAMEYHPGTRLRTGGSIHADRRERSDRTSSRSRRAARPRTSRASATTAAGTTAAAPASGAASGRSSSHDRYPVSARLPLSGPPHVEVTPQARADGVPLPRSSSADGSARHGAFRAPRVWPLRTVRLGRTECPTKRSTTPRRLHRGDHAGPSRRAQHDRAADAGGARRGGDRAIRDRDVKVILLQGAGRSFCGGFNFAEGFRTGTRTSPRTANGTPGAT